MKTIIALALATVFLTGCSQHSATDWKDPLQAIKDLFPETALCESDMERLKAKADNQQNLQAQAEYAFALFCGIVITQRVAILEKEANQLYIKAVLNSHGVAMRDDDPIIIKLESLAKQIEQIKDMQPKHDLQAAKLAKPAAEKGIGLAEYVYAMLHISGRGGCAKDYGEAIQWLMRAAKHGIPDAMSLLAEISDKKDEARMWLEKAAAAGHSASQIKLLEERQYQGATTLQLRNALDRYNGNSAKSTGAMLTKEALKKKFGQPHDVYERSGRFYLLYKCKDGFVEVTMLKPPQYAEDSPMPIISVREIDRDGKPKF